MMCQAIEKNGKIQTNCGKGSQNMASIQRVQSMPLRLKEEPITPPSIDRKKEEIIGQQLLRMKNCYEGKLKGGICRDPIEMFLISHEKCPSCKEYEPILVDRTQLMKEFNIPFTLRKLDVKKPDFSRMFKKAGCNGLPCLVVRDVKNPTKLRKITEGIDKPIAFFSNIMKEPNPLVIKVNNNRAPRGLIRK